MTRRHLPIALAACVLAAIPPRGAAAQNPVEISARAASITVGGRLQTQLEVSSVEGSVTDLFLRRARIRLDVAIGDFIDVRLNPDFSGGGATLADAWARFDLDAVRLSVGQFKRAFSGFELASSTDLPIVERDGRIGGLDVCPGVGGPCTFSRLTQRLAFDGRDAGVRLDGSAAGDRLSWLATVTNGEGQNAPDVNDAKSVSGRATWSTGRVTVGVFGGVHDHEVALGGGEAGTEWAQAGGADVELGTWRDGFHLLAAAAAGDNWRAGPDADFTTVQLLASYYAALGRDRLDGVEPFLRASWADTGTGTADAGGVLLTPGVMLYFIGKNGVSFNLDAWMPEGSGDGEVSFKVQTYLYF